MLIVLNCWNKLKAVVLIVRLQQQLMQLMQLMHRPLWRMTLTFSISSRVLQLHYHRHTWSSWTRTERNCPMLDKHPVFKQLSVRYNTCLPSSASEERLFSAASLVLENSQQTCCLKPWQCGK